MKITPILLAPIAGAFLFVSPAQAEEPAANPVPAELQSFLSEMLKLTTGMLEKEVQKPESKQALADLFKPGEAKDGQTAEAQSLLGSLLKILPSSGEKTNPAPDLQSQLLDALKMLTQIVADAAPDREPAPAGTVDSGAKAPVKESPTALKTGGLTTGGLNGGSGESAAHTDDSWRKMFPQRENRR